MKSDYYGNPIFQDSDIFDLLYKDKLDLLSKITIEPSKETKSLSEYIDLNFEGQIPQSITKQEFDQFCQSNWFIPDSYKNLEIEDYVKSLCSDESELIRATEELNAFKEKGMLELLKVLKYVVDTFRENNVIWGVGRGSSVSSYVLFLLGIHKIDSLKYNLDWRDFLR